MGLSRQPAWRDKAGPTARHQLRSTMRATVAPLVAPAHVARQSGVVAPAVLVRPKGLDL